MSGDFQENNCMNKIKKFMGKRIDLADYMVLTGIFLGALYWALESLLNVFSPEELVSIKKYSDPISVKFGHDSSYFACF